MSEQPDYPGMPRWVKVSGIIVVVLILLVGIILVTGVGGQHGPSRHTPSGEVTPSGGLGGPTPGHTPPARQGP